MTVFPILAVSFIMNVVAVLFVICCVSLVLIILIQKGRGGGLSGAFGGAMAGGVLGSKTGDFLTWVTIGLVGMFLTLAVVMAKFYKPTPVGDYDVIPQTQQQPLESPEQPEPSDDTGDTAGQAGAGADINSPGS
jgi:preprotein translocase subunit SecG